MTSLINRNVMVGKARTSMRLEPELWSALEEICHREGMTLACLITSLSPSDVGATAAESRTSAVRVYALNYFREAANEKGHKAAGHGALDGPQATGWQPAIKVVLHAGARRHG